MDGGEISECGSSKNRVALARSKRHGMHDQRKVDDGRGDSDRDKNPAMRPMEFVARTQRGTGLVGVQQPVADIDAPGCQSHHGQQPERQVNVRRPREGQSPYHGYGGRIKARKVPQAQQSRRVEAKLQVVSKAESGRRCGQSGHNSILRFPASHIAAGGRNEMDRKDF